MEYKYLIAALVFIGIMGIAELIAIYQDKKRKAKQKAEIANAFKVEKFKPGEVVRITEPLAYYSINSQLDLRTVAPTAHIWIDSLRSDKDGI